jgi:CRISPR-associated protein Cas2
MSSKVRERLLCYDIADPSRLRRVHQLLMRQGLIIQKSVFRLNITEPLFDQLVLSLQDRIDDRHDDVRVYQVHRKARRHILGRSAYPEGVMLFDDGSDLLY